MRCRRCGASLCVKKEIKIILLIWQIITFLHWVSAIKIQSSVQFSVDLTFREKMLRSAPTCGLSLAFSMKHFSRYLTGAIKTYGDMLKWASAGDALMRARGMISHRKKVSAHSGVTPHIPSPLHQRQRLIAAGSHVAHWSPFAIDEAVSERLSVFAAFKPKHILTLSEFMWLLISGSFDYFHSCKLWLWCVCEAAL